MKTQLREMFISPIADQVSDLEAIADEVAPEAVVADSAHLGAALLCERRGLPFAGLGISALMLPSVDTAPFGSALPPERGGRFLNWLVFRVVFGDINRAFRRARASAGLPPGTGTYFDVVSPQLFLQPTVQAFEYPAATCPRRSISSARSCRASCRRGSGHRGGATSTARTAAAYRSCWSRRGRWQPTRAELIEPTLRALADEPVLVIATTATDGAGIAGELPENARVAPYIPYQALLPQVTALVTNGGYGGVQMALSHGVPLVVAGGSEEKPEIRLTLRRVERALQDVVRARRGLVVDERAAAGERDRALFDATLHRVLDADLTRWPDRRLSNELAKVKAARYLGAAEQLVPLVGTGHRTGAGTGHDVSDSTRRTSTEFVVGAPPRDGP